MKLRLLFFIYFSFLSINTVSADPSPEKTESLLTAVCGVQTTIVRNREQSFLNGLDNYLFSCVHNPCNFEYVHLTPTFLDINDLDQKSMCNFVLSTNKQFSEYNDDCNLEETDFLCSDSYNSFHANLGLTELNSMYGKKARCLYRAYLDQRLSIYISRISRTTVRSCLVLKDH